MQTEQGTAINPDAAQFRVAPDQIATVLSNADNVVNQLTEPQKQLRAMVQQRSLSVEQFKDRVIELKPALADFLGFIQRTGALSGFQLHPVGFILAQHEVATRTPQLAALIDSAIDQG